MSGKIEIDREGEVDFAKPLPRSLLRDSRLSFGARGLFAFLWDLPRGWTIRLVHLIHMSPEGRDALRSRLRELETVGAIRIEPIRAEGGKVAGKRWVLVAADRWAVEATLKKDLPEFTEERVFRSSVNPMIGNSSPKVLQVGKVLQEEAAPRAHARGTTGAAAASTGKRRALRPSGIITWLQQDVQAAETIEQQHASDEIAKAVAALSAAGKQPVPGLVEQQIERQRRQQETTRRLAREDVDRRAREKDELDPIAQANGEQLLPPQLLARLPHKSQPQETP